MHNKRHVNIYVSSETMQYTLFYIVTVRLHSTGDYNHIFSDNYYYIYKYVMSRSIYW